MAETDDSREERLLRILHEYLQAVDAGRQPDREDLLRRHPDFADDLAAFFAEQAKLEEIALAPVETVDAVPPNERADSGPHSTEVVGTVVAGRYKLLQQIGEGGMGMVWVAEQTQPVRRKVALKLIKAGMDSKTVLVRFEAERQALALMDHPNIAKVLDGGTTESGRPFFVMEYVKGIPFTQYCDDARLSIAERLLLFVPVCQAVQHAHQKGIVHRDLKPSNLLLCLYDGKPVPKVIDFGLAKAMHQPLTEHTLYTAHGVMMGTPLYMSPEQAEFNNLDVDTRTDIYALGVILYELLTGTTPLEKQRFKEAAWHEMLRLIKEEEPQRPSARLSGGRSLPSVAAQRQLEPVKLAKLVRGDLDWIVMKCLEKDRSRRYDTAIGLARDVERYLADEAVEACPPSASYRLRKFVRRNKGRVVAAGVLAAMLFLVVGLVLYGAWWAERQSAERRHEKALIAASNNDAFKATLDQIEVALKSARLAEAGTLIGQADKQLDEQTPADLRERHERLKKDKRTVRELEDIFEERWRVSPSDRRIDSQRAKRRYPLLFQSYGLAVGTEPSATTVEKTKLSVIGEALSSALTEWFFVDPKYPGLLAVVDLLDPEPTRASLRGAIAKDETDHIKELGEMIDGSWLAPAYAIGLGTHPAIVDGLRILKAAWTTYPDSFPLALTISRALNGGDDKLRGEAVGWSRTAIALRPNNPLAHYYHAVGLSGRRGFGAETAADISNAADELRRAIKLDPQFAKAHGRLAFVLYFNLGRDDPEALVAARKAIDLDDQNTLGHFVLYMQLFRSQKDYLEAARKYRRLHELFNARREDSADQGSVESFAMGWTAESFCQLLRGLIGAAHPFAAYSLMLDYPGQNDRGLEGASDDDPDKSLNYLAACAAALAGTGQGLDAPTSMERAAIRKRALERLNSNLDIWKKHAETLSVWSASIIGWVGSPSGEGPLLVASALVPESSGAAAGPSKYREVVNKGMDQWLSDSNLAGVRDDQWLDKLPADEQEQWRKLWGEVRSLRDRTAPAKSAPAPGAGK